MSSDDLYSDGSEDPWPDEPDPPSETLDLEIPSVPDYSDRDVPTAIQRTFWIAVVLLNVAVGAFCLGVMLIGFEGRWKFGGGLVALGLFSGARTWSIYRKWHDEKD